MNLKTLMVDTKSVWIDYPGMPGFRVEIAHLSREALLKLRKSCVTSKIDRSTRRPVEELDEKRFVSEFTRATLKNWEGLKYEYLEELMLVDVSEQDPQATLEYNEDNAEALVTGSGDFDTWLNEEVFDLQNFRTKRD